MLRLLLLSLSVGRQSVSVSATVTAVSEPSVSEVVLVTVINGLQLRRHFRLLPKPEKTGVGRSLAPTTTAALMHGMRPLWTPTVTSKDVITALDSPQLNSTQPNWSERAQHFTTDNKKA